MGVSDIIISFPILMHMLKHIKEDFGVVLIHVYRAYNNAHILSHIS